ncbi:Uma2 family endonuclease [Nocardia seriolae]|nr:Uma2 family endonuclease [Nocardia seriolae]QOW30948.1 Uma2 family endonuclease [Nocardia seriolae]QUN15120.1 Uma2 family endonuclease [Nocardia seriolae]WKY51196.1 Uma2 family endonuclease [Nocardia seriolae]
MVRASRRSAQWSRRAVPGVRPHDRISDLRHRGLGLPATAAAGIESSHVKTDRLEKMSEYAAAGIPWYWLVSVSDTEVTSIETYGLDHSVGHYRLARTLKPGTGFAVDLPVRIQIDWEQLTDLVL